MSRILVQKHTFGALRWVVIAVLIVATAFPFYYMAELSLVPIEQVLLHPDRLWVPLQNLTLRTYADVMMSQDDGGQGFGGFMLNSALVALATVAVTLWCPSRVPTRCRG
ncbi:ABC transporter permease family protein [Leifsonia xyli]|jgi:multiple sugar transport system permease protein|uniref:hypothetical protein n=1 Tax=Leifsonia xyli TaxID=1575 RepID=UPI00041E93C2|nr:hypothetical protein [Leifsonia xyli]